MGNYTDTRNVNFTIKGVPITSLTISQSTAGLYPGEQLQLGVTANPKETTEKIYWKWESSNPAVAEVNEEGLITAKKSGLAVITVHNEGSSVIAKCSLTVAGQRDIGEAEVAAIPDQLFQGVEIKPELQVTYQGETLAEGTDYQVSYAGNMVCGFASVTLEGINRFKGTKENITFKIVPNKPVITELKGGYQSVKLTWDYVFESDAYRLYYRKSTDTSYTYAKTVDWLTNTATISNLDSGAIYYFKVRAYATANDEKIYGASSSAKSEVTAAAKTSVSALTPGTGKVKVSWKKVSKASGYVIYQATSKNGTYKKVKTVSSSTSSATITGLKSGRKYYYKVRAYRKGKYGNVYSPYSSVKGTTTR